MLVSISEGDCLDGLLGAILLRAGDDMMAVGVGRRIEECRERVLVVGYLARSLARKCAVRAYLVPCRLVISAKTTTLHGILDVR
jgi:hypothetical protein